MNLTRDRIHTIGWGMSLVICLALTLALTFRVNAVKSQVRLAERQIAQLKQEKLFLETEFETRASQQQLKAFNDVDFGYQAPTVGQYLESERQLAAFGKPRSPDAPDPIRVASADAVKASVRTMMAVEAKGTSSSTSPFAALTMENKAEAAPKKARKSEDISAQLARFAGRAGQNSGHRE